MLMHTSNVATKGKFLRLNFEFSRLFPFGKSGENIDFFFRFYWSHQSVVEFASLSDMKTAIEKLDDTELNGRRIRLIEDRRSGRGKFY